MVAPASCSSLAEYIGYFEDGIAVLQSEANLERCARELGEDSAADGIDYLEVRWAPQLHRREGLSLERVIGAVVAGLEASPITAVAIVCALRQDSPAESLELARVAGRHAGRGVVGFDLAGDERRWPNDGSISAAFDAARAAGLRLTCHAGEAAGPESVAAALDHYRVERIAHGVSAARSPGLLRRLSDEGVVLDLCPTANWKCKAVPELAAHPLPALLAAGVRCTISTDSRTVADTTLTREFEIAQEVMGLDEDTLRRCNLTAYEARFGR
jgi:adenosine deaminase